MAGTKDRVEGAAGLIANTILTASSSEAESLEGVEVGSLQDGATCFVRATGGIYRFYDSVNDVSNPPTVVRPGDGSDGTWYLESGGSGGAASSTVIVRSVDDFPTPVAGVITLAADTVYEVQGQVDIGTNVLEFPTGSQATVVKGRSPAEDVLSNNSATGLITQQAAGDPVHVEDISLSNSGGPAVVYDGNGAEEITLEHVWINGATIGAQITDPALESVLHNLVLLNCSVAGMLLDGSGVALTVSDSLFSSCLIGIDLAATFQYNQLSIIDNRFNVAGGETGINQQVGAKVNGQLSTNVFEGAGTYTNGFDATTQNPPNVTWIFTDNTFLEESRAAATNSFESVAGVAVGPAAPVVGTWYDFSAATHVAGLANARYAATAAGDLTFSGNRVSKSRVTGSATLERAAGAETFALGIFYNGSLIAASEALALQTAAGDWVHVTCEAVVNMRDGDVLDLRWRAQGTGGTQVTAHSAMIAVDGPP